MNHPNETSKPEVEINKNDKTEDLSTVEALKQILDCEGQTDESTEATESYQVADSSTAETALQLFNNLEETDEGTRFFPINFQNSQENNDIFKKPESQVQYATSVSESNSTESHQTATKLENFRIFLSGSQEELHSVKHNNIKQVQLEVEDNAPSFYKIKAEFVSNPLVPGRLAEAYESVSSKYFVDPQNSHKTDYKKLQEQKIKEIVGDELSDEHFEKLKMYCSPDNLKTGLEITMKSKFPLCTFSAMNDVKEYLNSAAGNQGISDLQTIRKHKLRTSRDMTNFYTKKLKYRGLRFLALEESEPEKRSVDVPALVPGKDLLFRVRLYRPFPYSPRERKRSGNRHPVFCSDLVLSGRNTLEDLRDKFACSNDDGLRIDIADRIDNKPLSTCKELFPSGFLYINGVFYNDRRAGCVDYSAPVRDWAKRRHIGDFDTKDMHSVRLDQLIVKFGYPEVYMHQGNCEHLFTFSEVRLVGHRDPLDVSSYPCRSISSKNHTIYCTTCAEFAARWVVTECSRVPFDPAFFCDTCFKLYLYVDGKKIGHFKAYPYNNE